MLRDYESKVLAAKVGVVLGVVAFFVAMGVIAAELHSDHWCDNALAIVKDSEEPETASVLPMALRSQDERDRIGRARQEVQLPKCKPELRKLEVWRLERE